MLNILSIVLSIAAILFSYYVWKNPIDTSKKSVRVFRDRDNKIVYTVSCTNGKWSVEKLDINLHKTSQPYVFIADSQNNKNLKEMTDNLSSVQKLNYRMK